MLDWNNWSPEAVVGVTLVSLLLVVLAVVIFMCIQAGLFHKIHIRTTRPEFGELVVMYKCGRGAYSESGTLFTESHSLMPQYNTIGVYYDDPEKKTSENLRYIVGLVLSEGGAPVKAEDETLLESHGYKRTVFPAVRHAVVADFPYRSTLSCIFAVFRVYPALREYVERRELCAHPIVELYDNTTSRILFAGPLEQQDSFYVPDVLEDPDVLSSPGEESCDDDDYERGPAAAPITEEDEGSAAEGDEGGSARAGSEQRPREGDSGWEKSASLLAAEGDTATPEVAGSVPQGSAEESDTNTGSSFEEIDPTETAALPSDDSPAPPAQLQEDATPAPPSQPLEGATPTPSLTTQPPQEPASAQEAEQKAQEAPAIPSSNDEGQVAQPAAQ